MMSIYDGVQQNCDLLNTELSIYQKYSYMEIFLFHFKLSRHPQHIRVAKYMCSDILNFL